MRNDEFCILSFSFCGGAGVDVTMSSILAFIEFAVFKLQVLELVSLWKEKRLDSLLEACKSNDEVLSVLFFPS